jgi:cell wall-associated NlpC family hydrolase
MTMIFHFRMRLCAAFLFAAAAPLAAQNPRVELAYGPWWHGSVSSTFTASYFNRLVGPFDYGLGLVHLRTATDFGDRRQTGGELSLAIARDGVGPYAVAAAGLIMGHGGPDGAGGDGSVHALWSAGAGFAVSPFRFLSLGLEARYQVEDSQIHGFWRSHPDDLRGVVVQVRAAVGFGGSSRRSAPATGSTAQAEFQPPSESEITRAAGGDGDAPEAALLRTQVVETALEVMGTPYRWGGSDGNGFDCSGLIQYAYGEHGLILPRVSHDQARTGMAVDRGVANLLPGDILGFSVERSGITHVGLYVGDGMFIHSASGGVKLSSLTESDPDNRWWQQRWVATRRIIN